VTSDLQKHSTVQTQTTDNQKTDYEYSRDTYYELIEKGKDALEDMVNVARESEHPRAFEVLSGMIKNISDVNDRLMDLNKKKKELDQKEVVKQVENQQNNFYLSTAELQKMMTKGDVIDVEPDESELLRES
jgi:DNA-binding PadR family transcriptional regulator